MSKVLAVLYYKDVAVETHAVVRQEGDEDLPKFYDRQRDLRRDWLHKKRMNPDNTPPLWHAAMSTVLDDSELSALTVVHQSTADFFKAVGYDSATGTFSSREPATLPSVPKTFKREFPSRRK